MPQHQLRTPLSLLVALACLLAMSTLTSCNSSKYLAPGEYLVDKNKVKLAKGASVDNWRAMQLELANQIVTKPNGNFLFLAPREWFYLRGEQRQDSTRFASFVQRIIAEPPAYLDLQDTEASVNRLRTYMLNRGYFEADVRAEIDTIGKHKVKVEYIIHPQQAYRYKDITYTVPNSAIASLLEKTISKRELREGQRVDSRDYDKEVLRIVSLLRDNGFANFYANSISPLEADSVGHQVNAELAILAPSDTTTHQTYRIGKVTVFPDNDPLATSTTVSIDTSYDGLRFIYSEEALSVKPATLADNIFFRPGDLFTQSDITKTNLQLNNLGVFRFVSIQQVPSADEENEIDFLIQLSQNEEWEIGGGVEASFTDRQAVSGGRLSLIGGELNGTLSNRNLLGGAERLTASLNAGLEFNFAKLGNADVQRLNTVEFGGGIVYQLPRFVDYFGLYRNLNRVQSGERADGSPDHFITDAFYQALTERATTKLSLSASYVDLLNFYTTTTVSSSFGYTVSPNPRDLYTINHVGFDYYTVSADSAFNNILDATPFLRNSLSDQVFTGMLFRSISFTRNTAKAFGGIKWTLLADFEQSGFEIFLANRLSNAFSGSEQVWSLGSGLDYARYVRGVGSAAGILQVGQRQSIAFRGLLGTALTFGFDRRNTAVPYVRQFFGGGNSSLRGWNARAVGPGGYRDSLAIGNNNIAAYQQADFKLEVNAEFRSYLTNISTTVLEGAIFVDAGNIWTLARDETRPGSQFRFTELKNGDGVVINEPFYEQVAINTGVGLRWDISYVLLRLDLGIKLRNPYEINGSHFPRSFGDDGQARVNYAIGLNYPF